MMIPEAVYKASESELRRYPPEIRFVTTSADQTQFIGDPVIDHLGAFQSDQMRHYYVQQMSVRVTGTISDSATWVNSLEILMVDLSNNYIGTIWSARNLVAQAIIGDTGLASTANAGLIASYYWNLRQPFIMPSGHKLNIRARFTRVTGGSSGACVMSSLATVGALGFPEGNMLR